MGHQHGGRDPGHRRPGHFTTINDPHAPPVSTFVEAINNSGLITGDTSTPTACFSGSSTGVGCSPRSMTRPRTGHGGRGTEQHRGDRRLLHRYPRQQPRVHLHPSPVGQVQEVARLHRRQVPVHRPTALAVPAGPTAVRRATSQHVCQGPSWERPGRSTGTARLTGPRTPELADLYPPSRCHPIADRRAYSAFRIRLGGPSPASCITLREPEVVL